MVGNPIQNRFHIEMRVQSVLRIDPGSGYRDIEVWHAQILPQEVAESAESKSIGLPAERRAVTTRTISQTGGRALAEIAALGS